MIVSKPATNKFFRRQFGNVYNKICLVCSSKSPIYTNLTLATYLCAKCAGKQRATYKIKSTIHDKWTEDELKRMYVGGNKLASESNIMQSDSTAIDAYASNIDTLQENYTGDIYEEEETKASENASDEVEVEEQNVPKIGSVYNKEDLSSEEEAQDTKMQTNKMTETQQQKITQKSTEYKVKTNEYSFVQKSDKKLVVDGVADERLGLAATNVERTETSKEQKYSYKNLLQPKKRQEEKTNIKKVVKNVTETSKVFVNNLINKFKK